jgi:hypothetical protein
MHWKCRFIVSFATDIVSLNYTVDYTGLRPETLADYDVGFDLPMKTSGCGSYVAFGDKLLKCI